MEEDLKIIEGEIVPIYENVKGERLVDARGLHVVLGSKRRFGNWITQRIEKYKFIENRDFIKRNNFVTVGNLRRPQIDYYLTVDMTKELCMIENNEKGRQIRQYFIEIEKRYRRIVESPQNIFDVMRTALHQIEADEKILNKHTEEIEDIKRKIDVIIQKDYCLASDIAEQLEIYSENNLPHSNLVGAIARLLGMKISYKHYYEDEQVAIVPDVSKENNYYQVYYKPKAVEKIIKWFNENKKEIEYKIIYERNTKNGVKGEIKEKGYKIEDVCYKVK